MGEQMTDDKHDTTDADATAAAGADGMADEKKSDRRPGIALLLIAVSLLAAVALWLL